MGPRAVTDRARALAREAAGPLGRRHPALLALGVATLLFLAAPLAVVVPISFSAAKYLTFPPPGWSLQWYERYFGSREWMSATVRSFEVALLTTLAATVVGTAAALALRRPFRGRSLVRLIILAPMVVPVIILAIGIYGLYAKLRMVGTLHGLVLAHTVLALPFVVVVVSATLAGFDSTLELAAQNLGANRWRTFRFVTLPLIRPGLTLLGLLVADVSGGDLPRGKPDPLIFVTAASEIGAVPGRCFVAEDAVSGVQAAKAGGMAALGVALLGDEMVLRSAGADLVVRTGVPQR